VNVEAPDLLRKQRRKEANDRWRLAHPERIKEFNKRYRTANYERVRAAENEYNRKHREQRRAYARAYHAANKEQRLEFNRTERHGITRTIRDWMYESQDGACAGCMVPMPDAELQIDHDHSCCPKKWSCGRCVRGLLCGRCNSLDVLAK
jgi:hypothetical protein